MSKRIKRTIFSLMCALVLLFLTVNRVGPRRIAQAIGLFVGKPLRPVTAHSPTAAAAGRAVQARGGGKRSCCGPPGAASLIWVMLGDPHFQPYLLESIRQARIFNPTEFFFVVVDTRFFNDSHPWVPEMDKLNVRA